MFGNKGKPEAGITLIASNCEIAGDINFSDELQVNGVVTGNIYAREGTKALVTITEKGRVEGEVRAPNVVVNGKVTGDIHSDKHVELAAKAEITGNVYYNLIEMVMGSRVEGKLVHVQAGRDQQQAPAQLESKPQPLGSGAGRQAASGDTSAAADSADSRAPVTAVPGKSGQGA